MIITSSASFARQMSYPVKSQLLFVGFQVFLLPAMILMEAFNLKLVGNAIHYVVSVQSFFTTTLFNYLVYDKRYPASIWIWILIGLFLHATGGFIFGHILRERFVYIKSSIRLLGSLIFFEITLTVFMIYVMQSTLWLDVWYLPSGW